MEMYCGNGPIQHNPKPKAKEYIDKRELKHRIWNGWLSNNGHKDADFDKPYRDVWREAGFNYDSPEFIKAMECLDEIIESMEVKKAIE